MTIDQATEIVAQEYRLTPAERKVLYLLSLGHSQDQIAYQTSRSYATIRNHIKHIYEKIDTTHKGGALSKVMRVMES